MVIINLGIAGIQEGDGAGAIMGSHVDIQEHSPAHSLGNVQVSDSLSEVAKDKGAIRVSLKVGPLADTTGRLVGIMADERLSRSFSVE